jgi:phosphatidylglycerol:prolipoprotein diacylglycerol transferase
VGIALGAFYASKHMESENEDPDLVWDALLWILIPALLGARLWYVGQAVLGGSTAFSFSRPLEILNPRTGGMNIFGGALFGIIAMIIYVRTKKLDGWVLADGALLGLLIGQGIGRFGNFINIELYGPPTNSDWFGIIVPQAYRLPQFSSLPPETRFHPTMLYEAAWLFISFGILYYLFRRYQKYMVHGLMTGGYFILAGIGRFIMEFWRPDQPGILTNTGVEISFSRIMSMFYVVAGIVIVLDRLGYLRIPFIERPKTLRQRARHYEEMERLKLREERARERERMRNERRRARRQQANNSSSEASPQEPQQIEES